MFIFGVLKRLRIPLKAATLITIFFIYSYGVLTNFSVSTNRAVVMMVVLLLAALVGKTYDMLSALSLSALIILLQNPLQILSAGFLLSFGAVLGIAVLLPRLKILFPTDHVVINSILISTSAQIATTPFILFFYYQFPSYSLLTNLIILPFVTVLTLTSILAGILGAIYLPLGIFLIGGAAYILKFYELICRVGSNLPGNLITTGKPDPLMLFLYFTLVCIFLRLAKRYQKKYSVLLLVIATGLLLLPKSNAGLEVTFLDVGQGDAIYMENSSGTSYLIDGGSADVTDVGKYRLEPFLKSQGTDKINYAVVSHSDNDHTSGLIQLIEQGKIQVETMLLPYINKKDEAYEELECLAEANGIRIRYMAAGDILKDGNVRIYCLHPGEDYNPSSTNAYSMVLSVRYGDFDLLLTGDLQKDGEQLVTGLLENGELWQDTERPAVDYEILKVSHHGSKESTLEEFLSQVKPEISIISCGEDNYYGHPHQEVLDRLGQIDSNIRITYKTGAVTIRTNGESMEINNYLKNTE
jgi:competence protein ComEC